MKANRNLALIGSAGSGFKWPGFVFEATKNTWFLTQWGDFFIRLAPDRQLSVGFLRGPAYSQIRVSLDDNKFAVNDTSLLPAGVIRDNVEDLIRVLTPLARQAMAGSAKKS
jgi:hypothetical protein